MRQRNRKMDFAHPYISFSIINISLILFTNKKSLLKAKEL